MSLPYEFIKVMFSSYGVAVGLVILSLFLLIVLLKSTHFVDYIKYIFSAKNRKIKQVNNSINLLPKNSSIKKALKHQQEVLIFDREFGQFLTKEKIDLVLKVCEKIGHKIHLMCIARAANFLELDERGEPKVMSFTCKDKAAYFLWNTVGSILILFGLTIFLLLYLSIGSKDVNLIPTPPTLQGFMYVSATIVIFIGFIFIGLVIVSLGWPYKHAQEIKEKLHTLYSKSVSDQSASELSDNMSTETTTI